MPGVQVVDVYFPKDRATNRRKNFCFVTFATQQVSSRPCMLAFRHKRSCSCAAQKRGGKLCRYPGAKYARGEER